MTKNKRYTFSLPPEAGKIIDKTPRMEKSKLVARAVLYYSAVKEMTAIKSRKDNAQ